LRKLCQTEEGRDLPECSTTTAPPTTSSSATTATTTTTLPPSPPAPIYNVSSTLTVPNVYDSLCAKLDDLGKNNFLDEGGFFSGGGSSKGFGYEGNLSQLAAACNSTAYNGMLVK